MTEIDLKEFREKYKISRDNQASMLGISLDTLNNWEYRGNGIPKMKTKHVEYVFKTYKSSVEESTPEEEYKKSSLETEIEKIVEAKLEESKKLVADKLEENQKELQDLNTKLDVVSEALSELILEKEEKKILKGIKRA
jgi:DNA-binding XRE family transcriptional regulator